MQTLWELFASPIENTKCFVFVSTWVYTEKVILVLNYRFLKNWINVGIPELYIANSPYENNTIRKKVFVAANVFPGKREPVLSVKTEG